VELHQRRHSRAAGAPALLQFDWLSKTRGAQAFGARPRGPGRDGRVRPIFPGGGRRRSKARLRFPKRADRRTNDGMHDLGGNAQSQAQAGVAASNHRPLITSDPYKALGSHEQRKT
jgi:hypothetical protein